MHSAIKILLLVLLAGSVALCRAQRQLTYNVTGANGDTSYVYQTQQQDVRRFGWSQLHTSAYAFAFRLTTSHQVITLLQNGDSILGKIGAWVRESVPGDEPATGRYYFKDTVLNSTIVASLKQLVLTSGILSIPTMDSITNWGMGNDGVSYTFESATPLQYTIKYYWSPHAQHGVKEAPIVQQFADSFMALANANKQWTDFQHTVPFEIYDYDALAVGRACGIEERRQYYRERQRYRRTKVYKRFRAANPYYH